MLDIRSTNRDEWFLKQDFRQDAILEFSLFLSNRTDMGMNANFPLYVYVHKRKSQTNRTENVYGYLDSSLIRVIKDLNDRADLSNELTRQNETDNERIYKIFSKAPYDDSWFYNFYVSVNGPPRNGEIGQHFISKQFNVLPDDSFDNHVHQIESTIEKGKEKKETKSLEQNENLDDVAKKAQVALILVVIIYVAILIKYMSIFTSQVLCKPNNSMV